MKQNRTSDYYVKAKRSMPQESYYQEGISFHGILISILSGIICQMTLYMAAGVNLFDLPIMFTILLWFVFAGFTGLIMDYFNV